VKVKAVLGATLLLSLLASPFSLSSVQANEDKVKISKSEVRFLKELNESQEEAKQKAKSKYKKALSIIEGYIDKKNIGIKIDLDDKKFQSFVKSLGTAFGEFSDNDMKEIIEFVKFIDLYENYDKNKKIKKLYDKIENEGALTNNEYQELINNMAVADGNTTSDSQTEEGVIRPLAYPDYNGYDGYAARDYAREWTSNDEILRNNDQFGYYSEYYNCEACWEDCTNFVSQALMAGGMRYWDWFGKSDYRAWFYNSVQPSFSWGGAHNFYLHWKYRAGVASVKTLLDVGDAVNADFEKDGDIDHTAIITYKDPNGKRWLTQHTVDLEEETHLDEWYSAGYNVYGYEIDYADY
jgi:hypothetical protein